MFIDPDKAGITFVKIFSIEFAMLLGVMVALIYL